MVIVRRAGVKEPQMPSGRRTNSCPKGSGEPVPSFTTHRDPWEPGGENVQSDLGQCEVQVRIADRAAGGGCTSRVSRVHGRWEAWELLMLSFPLQEIDIYYLFEPLGHGKVLRAHSLRPI